MTWIARLFRRSPKPVPPANGDDFVAAGRRRLEDDQARRRQVEEDLRILTRRGEHD